MIDSSSPMTASQMRGMAEGEVRNPPIKDKLLRRKQNLSIEMSKVDQLLQLLEKNPDIESFVDLMGGIQY